MKIISVKSTILFIPLAISCSYPPANLTPSEVVGTYRNDTCPNIELTESHIIVGTDQIPYELIRIKEDDIISSPSFLRYRMEENCEIFIVNSPVYAPIYEANGEIWFEILEHNQETFIPYRKASTD